MRNEKGFTLIEILIVLAIISLVSAASMPFLVRAKEGIDLRIAATNLSADLRYVQQRNISGDTANSSSLLIDRTNNLYIVRTSDKNRLVELPSNINIKRPDNTEISFSKYGRPSNSRTIVLENSYDKKYSVIVAPVTGIIRVVSGEYFPDD